MVAYAEVLVHLQKKELFLAKRLASNSFFDAPQQIKALPKSINLMRGMGNALCILEDVYGKNNEQCLKMINEFNYKVKNVEVNPSQISWSERRTLEAINGI